MRELTELLPAPPTLSTLTCSPALDGTSRASRHLSTLRLGYNKITDAGAAGFRQIADDSCNTSIQHLHLGGNPMPVASGKGRGRNGNDVWAIALEKWPLLFS